MSKIYEGFSISHAAILNGSTGVEETWGDIYGVREGRLEVNVDTYDNQGDDSVLSSFFWFNYCTVTIQGGYLPFELMANLMNANVTSSGSAPNDTVSMPLWNQSSVNTATRPMIVRVPSKDSDGALRNLDIVLYKVQFEPFSFDGPSYKNGLLLNYTGKALISAKDEKGSTLSEKAIGRLISSPA